MTDINAAATLSLEINTGGAEQKLATIAANYSQLVAALSQGGSAKALVSSDAQAATLTRTIAQLAISVNGLNDKFDSAGKGSVKALRAISGEMDAVERLVSQRASSIAQSMKAVPDAINSAAAAAKKLSSTSFGLISANARQLEEAYKASVTSAVASMREAEAAEIASSARRRETALKAIADRRKAETDYTTWYAAELAKRDAQEAASSLRTAQQRSGLQKVTSERLDRSLVALPPGKSSLAQYYLSQGASMGGGNYLQQMEQAAKSELAFAMAISDASDNAVRANSSITTLASGKQKLANSTKVATDHQHSWNKAANEAHAFARGLSGSLGVLWMTYGSMAPLLAGAALAGSFKAAATAGSEFAYQLEFVRALGDESADSVARMSESTLNLARSALYGPVELANGLRILAQAGLNADQAMRTLPTTMQLATVGEMSMEQAAITLTGVMNAFKMSVSDMPHIGDVFAKAAAVSQTSVVGMTEAMKTASVVGTQYNASLEDTATALTVLAKVNIQGTAAGTSMRNMLKELYTPVPAAAAAIKKLGLETSDAAGNMRPFPDIIYDLQKKLEGFDKASQTQILQRIFGERGAKEAIAMLTMTRQEWEKLKASISDSGGFMSNVSKQLEMTAKGQFMQAANALKVSLIEAFQGAEPAIRALAVSLKDLANNEAVKTLLTSLVGVMATLASWAVKLAPLLLTLGTAFIGLKVAAAAGTAITALSSSLSLVASVSAFAGGGLNGLRLGLLATSSAAGAAAGASSLGGVVSALGLLNPWTIAVAASVGALAIGYAKLNAATPEFVNRSNLFTQTLKDQLVELQRTNAELQKRRRLLTEGTAVDTSPMADTEKSLSYYADMEMSASSTPWGWVQKQYARYQQRDLTAQKFEQIDLINKARKAEANNRLLDFSTFIDESSQKLDALKKAGVKAGTEANVTALTAMVEGWKKGEPKSQQQVDAVKKAIDGLFTDIASYMPSGTATWGGDDKGTGASKFFDPLRAGYEEQTNALKQQLQQQLDLVKAQVETRQKLEQDANDESYLLSTRNIEQRRVLLEQTLTKATNPKLISDLKKQLDILSTEGTQASTTYIENAKKILDEGERVKAELGKIAGTYTDDGVSAAVKKFEIDYLSFREKAELMANSLNEKLAEEGRLRLKLYDISKLSTEVQAKGLAIQQRMNLTISDLQLRVQEIRERTEGQSILSQLFGDLEIADLVKAKLPEVEAALRSLREEAARLRAEGLVGKADETDKMANDMAKSFVKLQRESNKTWNKMADELGSALSDSLADAFINGKDGGKDFFKTLEAMAKTAAIRLAVSVAVTPIVDGLKSLGTTLLGGSSSSASGGGILNSAGNLLSTGKTAYSLYSNGVGSTAGAYVQGLGNLVGSSTMSAYGTGMGLSTLEAESAALAYEQAFAETGNVLYSQISTSLLEGAEAGAASSGMLSGAMTAMGYAAAFMAAVGLLFNDWDSGGAPKTAFRGWGSLSDGQTMSGELGNPLGEYMGGRTDRDYVHEVIDELLNDAFVASIKKINADYDASAYVGGMINWQGKSDNQMSAKAANAAGELIYSVSRESGQGSKGWQKFLNAEGPRLQAAIMLDAMRTESEDYAAIIAATVSNTTDLTSALKDLTAEGIAELTTKVNDLINLFDAFNEAAVFSSEITADQFLSLADKAGGADKLASLTDAYMSTAYSEQELFERQFDTLKSKLEEGFGDLVLNVPTDPNEIKSLVSNLDGTTAEGQTVIDRVAEALSGVKTDKPTTVAELQAAVAKTGLGTAAGSDMLQSLIKEVGAVVVAKQDEGGLSTLNELKALTKSANVTISDPGMANISDLNLQNALVGEQLAKLFNSEEMPGISNYVNGLATTGAGTSPGGVDEYLVMLSSSTDDFNKLISTLDTSTTVGQAIFDALAEGIQGLGVAAPTTVEGLADLVNGLDITSKVGQDIMSAVAQGLGDVGVALPETIEQFNALVEATYQGGKINEEAFLSLMSMYEDFQKMTETIEGFRTIKQGIIDTYKTEAEKQADTQAMLLEAFSKLNLAVPQTVEQFVALAKSADPATEYGRSLIATLQEVQSAFDSTAKAASATTLSLITSNVTRFGKLVSSGVDYLQQAAELEIERAQAAKDAAQESLDNIKSIVGILGDAADDLYGNVGNTAAYLSAQAIAQLDQMLATAQNSGYLPDPDLLSDTISKARAGLNKDQFTSTYDYEKAQLILAGKLTQLEEIGTKQLPVAEVALSVANSQLSAAETALSYYQEQIEALTSIDEGTWNLSGSIESIGQAILDSLSLQATTIANSIVTALASGRISAADASTQLNGLGYSDTIKNGISAGSNGAVIAGSNLYATNGWSGSVDAAKKIVAEAFGSMTPIDFYTAALGVGLSGKVLEQMYDLPAGTIESWAKANNVPAFAVGTDYVPENMLALVHRGEKITPAAYNGQQEKYLEELVKEIRALRAQMDDVKANTRSSADSLSGINGPIPVGVE